MFMSGQTSRTFVVKRRALLAAIYWRAPRLSEASRERSASIGIVYPGTSKSVETTSTQKSKVKVSNTY